MSANDATKEKAMNADTPKVQYGVVFPDGRIEWDSLRLGKDQETAEAQGKAQDFYKREVAFLGVDPSTVALRFVKREWTPAKETDVTK